MKLVHTHTHTHNVKCVKSFEFTTVITNIKAGSLKSEFATLI